jgi:hypothetical protein
LRGCRYRQTAKRPEGLPSDDPVDGKVPGRLEGTHGTCRDRAEQTVDPAGVVGEPLEPALHLADAHRAARLVVAGPRSHQQR